MAKSLVCQRYSLAHKLQDPPNTHSGMKQLGVLRISYGTAYCSNTSCL